MDTVENDFKSRKLLAGLGIDLDDMRSRREEAVRAAVAEATEALRLAEEERKAAEQEAAPRFRQLFIIHVAGRDFQTTQENVDVVLAAIESGGPPVVKIVARTDLQAKAFTLYVNVGQIAYIRASTI